MSGTCDFYSQTDIIRNVLQDKGFLICAEPWDIQMFFVVCFSESLVPENRVWIQDGLSKPDAFKSEAATC